MPGSFVKYCSPLSNDQIGSDYDDYSHVSSIGWSA